MSHPLCIIDYSTGARYMTFVGSPAGSNKLRVLVSDRKNLNDRALVQVTNKLAIKYYDEYMKPDGTFPSGKKSRGSSFVSEQKMYVLLKGARTINQFEGSQRQ
jgi:hypothetical protein